jgi:hypothetical protein
MTEDNHDALCPPELRRDPGGCMCAFIKAIRKDERKRLRSMPSTCPTCMGFGRFSTQFGGDQRACDKCAGSGRVERSAFPEPSSQRNSGT